MKKSRYDCSEPHPYYPNLGVQKAVIALLLRGKKIPWAFRHFGSYADDEIYASKKKIGQERDSDLPRFYKLQDPTPEELIELNYFWEHGTELMNGMSKEQLNASAIDELFNNTT